MSEENPNTTAVTNPVKTHDKDPKKVEAGRRIAKISQEAKARKRAQREAMKEEQNILDVKNKCEGPVITQERVGMVVGITVGLVSFYVMWCNSLEKIERKDGGKQIRRETTTRTKTARWSDLLD